MSGSPRTAPTIETERLRLRAHRLEDLPACARMWADPNVTRYVGGKPQTEQESWNRLLRYAGHWALLGFGYWVVEEKAAPGFVGEIGFVNYKRALEPPRPELPEIGWAFVPAVHGKGYATEAARAVIAWGDAHLDSPETFCLIDPQNSASIRIAEKCGYRVSQGTIHAGHSVLVFVR